MVKPADGEMARVSVTDERQLALAFAVAVAELYGDEAGREVAGVYDVPAPKLKAKPRK